MNKLQTEEKPIADTPEQNITGETYNRGSRFPKREVPNNIDTTPDTDNTTLNPNLLNRILTMMCMRR
jgi:hypothetical protein